MADSPVPSETPILDLLEPMPKPRHQKPIHAFAYSLLIVAIFGFITNNYAMVLFYASFLFVLLLVIATHEFGHLTAGWIAGLSFVSVSISSLSLVREKSRLRVQSKRSTLWGQANMSLARLPNARKKLIALVVGGPIASLTCGLGALVLAPTVSPYLGELSSAMYGLFAYFSLLTFFIGLFPARLDDAHRNDALLLKTLLTSRPGTRQLLASYATAMQRRNGVDAINMNLRWANLANDLGTPSHRQYSTNLQSYQGLSDSHPSQAAKSLEKCLAASAILTVEQRDHLIAEAAYFSAKHRRDPGRANTWLKRVSDLKNLHTLTVLSIEVAILSTTGDYADALRACDKGITFLRQFSATTRARAMVSTWHRELERLEAAACSVVASP